MGYIKRVQISVSSGEVFSKTLLPLNSNSPRSIHRSIAPVEARAELDKLLS